MSIHVQITFRCEAAECTKQETILVDATLFDDISLMSEAEIIGWDEDASGFLFCPTHATDDEEEEDDAEDEDDQSHH